MPDEGAVPGDAGHGEDGERHGEWAGHAALVVATTPVGEEGQRRRRAGALMHCLARDHRLVDGDERPVWSAL